MKKTLLLSLALCCTILALLTACKHSSRQHHAAVPGAKYICPMNCEKGKTYDQPGSCPVCHMDLEVAEPAQAAPAAYFTAFAAEPARLEAGKAALLSFTPKRKGDESAPVPLDLVHGKKMHLILVSDDLSWFDHIHPEYQPDGAYRIKALGKGEAFGNGRGQTETRFDAGGKYWAFVDYKPTGGLNQVDKLELDVAGTPARPVAYTQPRTTTTVDGYTITLHPPHDGGTFRAGGPVHMRVSFQRNGQAVDPATFENYLGEKAHAIMLEVASKEYIHTHPAAVDGGLEVHTQFAKAGTYRAWLQFQTEGTVHTADFVLNVAEAGSAGH